MKVGFGGSCHWCTEAIFLSILGVKSVAQGWVSGEGNAESFSEAVIVEYNSLEISLQDLIAIHLHTHSCTSSHNMRNKYRSAVYYFNAEQEKMAKAGINFIQLEYMSRIITEVIAYKDFKLNTEQYRNYYFSNPEKPFCENIVNPKLRLLLTKFSKHVNHSRLKHLTAN